LEPENSDAYALLGAIYIEKNQLSKAKKLFDKAVELDDKNGGALVGLGNP
jgi:cytochrome c-type biogenesis protein CcmH/NrfG